MITIMIFFLLSFCVLQMIESISCGNKIKHCIRSGCFLLFSLDLFPFRVYMCNEGNCVHVEIKVGDCNNRLLVLGWDFRVLVHQSIQGKNYGP